MSNNQLLNSQRPKIEFNLAIEENSSLVTYKDEPTNTPNKKIRRVLFGGLFIALLIYLAYHFYVTAPTKAILPANIADSPAVNSIQETVKCDKQTMAKQLYLKDIRFSNKSTFVLLVVSDTTINYVVDLNIKLGGVSIRGLSAKITDGKIEYLLVFPPFKPIPPSIDLHECNKPDSCKGENCLHFWGIKKQEMNQQ